METKNGPIDPGNHGNRGTNAPLQSQLHHETTDDASSQEKERQRRLNILL
jgi:hypothetical protein